MTALAQPLRPLKIGQSPTLEQYVDAFKRAPDLSLYEFLDSKIDRSTRRRLEEQSLDLSELSPEVRMHLLQLTKFVIRTETRADCDVVEHQLQRIKRRGRASSSIISDAIVVQHFAQAKLANPTSRDRQLHRTVAIQLGMRIGRTRLAVGKVRHAVKRYMDRLDYLLEAEPVLGHTWHDETTLLYHYVVLKRLAELRGDIPFDETASRYASLCKAFWKFGIDVIRYDEAIRRSRT